MCSDTFKCEEATNLQKLLQHTRFGTWNIMEHEEHHGKFIDP